MKESDFLHRRNFFRLTKPCECGSREEVVVFKDSFEEKSYCPECSEGRHLFGNRRNGIHTPLSYFLTAVIYAGTWLAGWYVTGRISCEKNSHEVCEISDLGGFESEVS